MARSLLEAYSGNNIGTRGGVVGREFDARPKHGLTPRYIVPQGDAFEGRAIDVCTLRIHYRLQRCLRPDHTIAYNVAFVTDTGARHPARPRRSVALRRLRS